MDPIASPPTNPGTPFSLSTVGTRMTRRGVRRTRWKRSAIWSASFTVQSVVTLIMLACRGALEKAHIALIYLMVVLVGSAADPAAVYSA